MPMLVLHVAAVSPEEAGAVVPRQGMDLALPHSGESLLNFVLSSVYLGMF